MTMQIMHQYWVLRTGASQVPLYHYILTTLLIILFCESSNMYMPRGS